MFIWYTSKNVDKFRNNRGNSFTFLLNLWSSGYIVDNSSIHSSQSRISTESYGIVEKHADKRGTWARERVCRTIDKMHNHTLLEDVKFQDVRHRDNNFGGKTDLVRNKTLIGVSFAYKQISAIRSGMPSEAAGCKTSDCRIFHGYWICPYRVEQLLIIPNGWIINLN